MSFSEKGMSASIDILEKARRNENTVLEVPITCSYANNNYSLSVKSILHGVTVALAVLRIRLKACFACQFLPSCKRDKPDLSFS
jgi:hypothetical protein